MINKENLFQINGIFFCFYNFHNQFNFKETEMHNLWNEGLYEIIAIMARPGV